MKLVVGTLAVLFSVQALSAVVVGKVDLPKVLVSVHQGAAVRDQLKKTFDEKQKLLKDDEDKIRKMQDDFQKKMSVLNEKEKNKKDKEIQEKFMNLQQKTATFQKDLQDLEQKLKAPILEKIKQVVDDTSKETGVDLVYEASSAPILYAKEEKDLTDDVIKQYNKKFPK